MSYVSVCVTPQSTVGTVVLEALLLLGCQVGAHGSLEGPWEVGAQPGLMPHCLLTQAQSAQSFQLVEVLMDSRQGECPDAP